MTTWASALYDESSYPDVVHTGSRGYLSETAGTFGINRPSFKANALNGLPGILFGRVTSPTSNPALEETRLISPQMVISNRTKATINDNANWHRAPLPGMDDGHQEQHECKSNCRGGRRPSAARANARPSIPWLPCRCTTTHDYPSFFFSSFCGGAGAFGLSTPGRSTTCQKP